MLLKYKKVSTDSYKDNLNDRKDDLRDKLDTVDESINEKKKDQRDEKKVIDQSLDTLKNQKDQVSDQIETINNQLKNSNKKYKLFKHTNLDIENSNSKKGLLKSKKSANNLVDQFEVLDQTLTVDGLKFEKDCYSLIETFFKKIDLSTFLNRSELQEMQHILLSNLGNQSNSPINKFEKFLKYLTSDLLKKFKIELEKVVLHAIKNK